MVTLAGSCSNTNLDLTMAVQAVPPPGAMCADVARATRAYATSLAQSSSVTSSSVSTTTSAGVRS